MSTRRELEHDRGVAYEEMMRYARAMEDYRAVGTNAG